MAYAPHHGMRDPAVEGRSALVQRVMQHFQQNPNFGASNGGPPGINPGGPMGVPHSPIGNLSPQLLALLQQHLAGGRGTPNAGGHPFPGGQPNQPPMIGGVPHFLGPPTPAPPTFGGPGGRGEGLPQPQLGMPGMGQQLQIPHDVVDLGGGVLYSPTHGYIHAGTNKVGGGIRPGMGSGNSPY